MKYYTKQKFNDTFEGFYLPEVHETMFDTIPHMKTELKSVQVNEYDEDLGIEVPKIKQEEMEVLDYIEYRPKFEPFIVISEEEHTKLLNEVNNSDGELRFNENGELVVFHKVKTNKVYLKPEYDYINNVTIETATQEELRKEYIKTINNLKTKILETGFDFTHSNGNVYKQKLRPYKDIPLATSTKSFLKRHSEHTVTWSFDDEHMNVEMTLEEIERLEDEGVIYTNAVFEVERDLKSSEVNLDLTFEDFDKLVKEKLNSFTFSLRGVLHE